MLNEKDSLKLGQLIIELVDGTISDEKIAELNLKLQGSSEALDFYRDFMKNSVVLDRRIDVLLTGNTENLSPEYLRSLADLEGNAPAIELQCDLPLVEPESKPQPPIRSNSWVYVVLTSIAAVLMVLLFVYRMPSQYGVPVAELTDMMGAKWVKNQYQIDTGYRFISGSEKYRLKYGIAQLEFENGTVVTFEGPAEFQILASDMVELNYGRVFAKVSPEAYGFQVSTAGARIIDLGTEFGVQKTLYGSVELHVIKGKTCLISGSGDNKIDIDVTEDSALKLDNTTGRVDKVECDNGLFVRGIDSQQNLIWRGDSAPIAIANHSFERPDVGLNAEYVIDDWQINGSVGICCCGVADENILNHQGGNARYIDSNLVDLANCDGKQVAWLNTDVGTSAVLGLASKYNAGMSYELTVALAAAAWNEPDAGDQMQVQLCYRNGKELVIASCTTVKAEELNLSDGKDFIDYKVVINDVKPEDVFQGKNIFIRIVSTFKSVETEVGDWVIDNVRLNANNKAFSLKP